MSMPKPTSKFSFSIFLLLAFVMVGRPQDVFHFLEPLRLALSLTLLSLLAVVLQGRSVVGDLLRDPMGRKYLVFYGIMVMGIPFALYSRAAFNFIIFKYMVNIIFFGLFLMHVHSYERMRSVVLTIVCSLCFYGTSSVLSGVFEGGRFGFGSMYDPNDLAYMLVSLAPLAALYLGRGERLPLKLLAGATLAVSLLVTVYTGSRGGLIGLAVALYLLVFSRVSPVRFPVKALFLIGVLVFIGVKSDMVFTERNATIFNLGRDYNVSDENGRLNLWKKGVKFTLANPLTGVGAMCFPEAVALDRRMRNSAETWQVVHNAFIQISSELGLIALAVFALLIRDTLKAFRKARGGKAGRGAKPGLPRLAGAAQIGFTSHLIVAFFLTQGYSILFTLFFAFGAAMRRLLEPVRGAS